MAKEKHAIHEWVVTYTEDMYRWAFHKVSHPELAQDLVQDTFLAATEKIGSFKGDSSPKTWLFSILNHKIIDYYRKKIKEPVRMETRSLADFFDADGTWYKNRRPHSWQEEEDSLLHDENFLAILRDCLEALPEKWSTSVKLKYLMSKKGEEICQEMGITPTNLWQIVHRARLQLRECIEENWYQN